MTKRTEITIETARVTVISKPTRMIGWCAACRKKVDWVTVDEAARLSDASTRSIFRMVEDGQFHFSETQEGILLLCSNSLMSESSARIASEE